MPFVKPSEEKAGQFMLVYGPSNVGKTTSILASCDLPAEYVKIEMRGLKANIEVANQVREANGLPLITDDNLLIYNYDNYEDFKDDYGKPRKTYPATVIVDSFTHLMCTHFMLETEDEQHEVVLEKLRAEYKKANPRATEEEVEAVRPAKNIATQNKQSQEGFGVISSAAKRITKIFGHYAANGGSKVIFVALEDEKSRMIDNKVMRVPLFAGQDYLKNFTGSFDLIGRVVPRTDKDGKKLVYPPGIRFESPASDFIAKWTGGGDKRDFLFDLQIIKPTKA